MTNEFLLAGFGGQGILFSGKFLAYDGLLENKYKTPKAIGQSNITLKLFNVWE